MPALAERRKQPLRGAGVFALAGLQRLDRGEIIRHRLPRGVVERHQPFLVALAAYHDHAGVAPRGRDRQRHQLGHAQARGVEHLEQAIEPHRAQPLQGRGFGLLRQVLGFGQHAVDVRYRQHLWQATAALGAGQDRGGIVLADAFVQHEAEQMPHRRQPPRHAGGFKPSDIEIGEIVAQLLGVGSGKGLPGAGQELREIGEVAAIGLQRVVARALFRREHVEEQVDQLAV